MEGGAIPENLHYKSPNTDIPGLLDGRLSVVAEKTNWNGGYVGINSFGFGGSNVHAVLKSNTAEKSGIHAVYVNLQNKYGVHMKNNHYFKRYFIESKYFLWL